MLQSKRKQFSINSWQRINMRNVSHLLGVELIHNLYNRHLPRINSIRFRNTNTYWKDGQVNSYAPKEEWDFLANWFGKKFLKLDKILLEQIENLLNFDRSFYNNFICLWENLNFKKLDNIDLGMTLIDIQDYTLGELYQVNLIQIEHALTFAIRTLLEKYEKDEKKRNELFSSLITTNIFTETQKEEINFNKIVKLGKNKKINDPIEDKQIFSQIRDHCKDYSFMHCAYGELPYDINFYLNKYKELYRKGTSAEKIIKNINERYRKSLKLLHLLNDKELKTLIPLMIQVGRFRDYNKAQLGKTIKYKLNILDEISRRGLEDRESLNYYLLCEILNLLEKREKVSKKEISVRKNKGVLLVRCEYLEIDKSITNRSLVNSTDRLKGICASRGIAIGKSKVILNKNEASKIKKGDIMIAIGTDFDLVEAIQMSSAVITEEGGLLSHAAVICREMSKPCCIGVGNATKRLRDGMYIKVDANNGIITII